MAVKWQMQFPRRVATSRIHILTHSSWIFQVWINWMVGWTPMRPWWILKKRGKAQKSCWANYTGTNSIRSNTILGSSSATNLFGFWWGVWRHTSLLERSSWSCVSEKWQTTVFHHRMFTFILIFSSFQDSCLFLKWIPSYVLLWLLSSALLSISPCCSLCHFISVLLSAPLCRFLRTERKGSIGGCFWLNWVRYVHFNSWNATVNTHWAIPIMRRCWARGPHMFCRSVRPA